ncbi:pfkB family kinase [Massarina eburnea CBS 473.64]|uniref:PfkB family kinase n=1 Tax=Massarina eburnea CBS 473.64 TaxID=1395130 RepID=A0A6A6RS10_9PLEO|nr:pfkB family kinase [Massarina eburnea CBS 473.64]
MASTTQISCVSLGMFIIDEIHMPHHVPLIDVLGGSAAFVTLGQRLFSSMPQEIGCLIIAGNDFPLDIFDRIEGWGTTLEVKVRESDMSTRGKLVYKDNTFGPKTFEYLGEPLRATPPELIGSPLLRSKAFHFFGTPGEILLQVPQLLRLREREKLDSHPLIVWEPLPGECARHNRHLFLAACKLVDVFSPNHIEVAAIFDDDPSQDFDADNLEAIGQTILDSSIGLDGNGVVIIRAGEHGALAMSGTTRPTWLPSYYDGGSPRVVDPTGAGNTFLGGYIAGWQRSGNICEAMKYGHVAASFALEQIGLPDPVVDKRGGRVLWHGVSVFDRLREYKKRLSSARVISEGLL